MDNAKTSAPNSVKPDTRTFLITTPKRLRRNSFQAKVLDLNTHDPVAVCDHAHRTGAGAFKCGHVIVSDLRGRK